MECAISNAFLFLLFIYLKVSVFHPGIQGRLVHWLPFLVNDTVVVQHDPRQIPKRMRPRSRWPATRRQISWKWKKIHWSGGRSTSISIHSCHNLLKGTSVSLALAFHQKGSFPPPETSSLLREVHFSQSMLIRFYSWTKIWRQCRSLGLQLCGEEIFCLLVFT